MNSESITIKVISIDREKITGYGIGDIGGIGSGIIEIFINKNIYLGMLAEMKKAKIQVDNDLRCFENRIFTIVKKEWENRPKDLDTDIVYGMALRKDLEKIENERNEEVK